MTLLRKFESGFKKEAFLWAIRKASLKTTSNKKPTPSPNHKSSSKLKTLSFWWRETIAFSPHWRLSHSDPLFQKNVIILSYKFAAPTSVIWPYYPSILMTCLPITLYLFSSFAWIQFVVIFLFTSLKTLRVCVVLLRILIWILHVYSRNCISIWTYLVRIILLLIILRLLWIVVRLLEVILGLLWIVLWLLWIILRLLIVLRLLWIVGRLLRIILRLLWIVLGLLRVVVRLLIILRWLLLIVYRLLKWYILVLITVVIVGWNGIWLNVCRLVKTSSSIHVNICYLNICMLNMIDPFSLSFSLYLTFSSLSISPLLLSSSFFL